MKDIPAYEHFHSDEEWMLTEEEVEHLIEAEVLYDSNEVRIFSKKDGSTVYHLWFTVYEVDEDRVLVTVGGNDGAQCLDNEAIFCRKEDQNRAILHFTRLFKKSADWDGEGEWNVHTRK